MKKKISAVKVPHHKNTAGMQSVDVAPPKEVLIPTNMHSGGAAVPVVEVGQQVRVGQLIAREEGKNSSPVHATVSGTVKAIEPYALSGRPAQAIRIESDGKMEPDPAIAPPQVQDLDGFLQAVRDSGIVGLGGAAFPVWAKLDAVRKNTIKTVLINGAECEPFITSDHRMMLEHSDWLRKGVELLERYLKSEEYIIGIERNKPDAIEHLRKVFADDPAVKVMPLDSVYPQGAKQVLLFNATGKVVGPGQRLASLGVIIINVTSLAMVGKYFLDGMPLISRTITVDGSAVAEPKNLTVPIGTPISYVVEQCGGLKSEPGKVIYGGPMMGKTVQTMDAPILKATNAILVLDKKDSRKLEPSPCIHCGRCVAACPLGLNPTRFAYAMEREDDEEKAAILHEEQVSLCMECGCCTFVCPAHRPLAESNSAAKGFIRKYDAARKEGGK
jgi:electron transport complex protein RnfC